MFVNNIPWFYADMACERNELMRNVYPLLKDYCREKHGMEFQVSPLGFLGVNIIHLKNRFFLEGD